MIIVETDRLTCIWVRTNRRVKWKYATWGGRYRNNEEALQIAKENMGDTPFEYLIRNLETDEETTGFVNWPTKSKR